MRQALQAIFVALLLTAGTIPTQAAQPWPTTRFEAFVGAPYMGNNLGGQLVGTANLDDEMEENPPHPSAIADVERAFREAAEWYQRKGFPAPNLLPIVETDAGPAYRIYLCRYQPGGFRCGYNPNTGKTKAGIYIPLCNNDPDRTRFIYLNMDKTIGGTLGLNELGYQTVAHELMHAIMDSTAFGTPSACGTTGGWITEGIPDAISYDIADELRQGRFQVGTTSEDVIKRYGYRPYSEGLPQRGDVPMPVGGDIEATYTSSSFWRYLANSHPDGWSFLIREKPKSSPGLLDFDITGAPGWQREVTWLNKGLRSKFNRGLNEMYGLFINQFIYRVAPMESYAGSPAEQNLEHWTRLLFDHCRKVSFGDTSKQIVTLDLDRIGSRCIRIEPTGTQGYEQITFSANSIDKKELQDVSIGQAGTTIVTRGSVAPDPERSGTFVSTWRDFVQDSSDSNLYLVSNTARQPAASTPSTLVLEVTRSAYSNSAWAGPMPPAKVAPKPQKPTYKKHVKRLSRQQSDTAKMVREQVALDKDSLTPNASRSAEVSRHTNIPACPEPFKYSACGPHFMISLALVPGSYGALGLATSQGGTGAQAMGGLMAMSQTSMFGNESTMKNIEAKLDAIDGSAVNIAFPLIDYGFTGTFKNADIHVDMAGGRTLRAFGPPDQNGNTLLTGKVTIEEYSPRFIRGSFEAPLAEFEANGDQEPIYRQRETVTGTFSSVAPWQSDERVQLIMDSTEQIGDDVANSLGVPAEMIHSMKQQGNFPGGGSAPVSGGGGALESGECSCECEYKPFADDLCELFCEDEFAACDDP